MNNINFAPEAQNIHYKNVEELYIYIYALHEQLY